MVKLVEIKELRDNEPVEILQVIDNMPKEPREKLFPDLPEFKKSKPKDLLHLFIPNIERAKIEHTDEIKGFKYNRLENSNLWNGFAITYMNLGKLEKAKVILKTMLDVGASDSSTLTNYGAVLLNKMLAIHRLDEKNFKIAKEYTFRAFVFDVPKKKLLYKGVLMPAFKNLVLIRNIESEHFLNRKEHFTSFILGWISIEMSLLRIWSKFLEKLGYGEGKREDMIRWDIKLIMEILSMANVIQPKIKSILDTLRETRNRLVHGTQLDPTEGQIRSCINVGRLLIPILP